jgi:hypothetical protein
MGIMLAEIAAHMQTAAIGTIGATSGWTIRVAEIPDTPDTAISLYETSGMASDFVLDGARDVNPGLQVRVRGARNGYLTARGKAEDIDDLLDGIANTVIGTHTYKWIRAVHQPVFLGHEPGTDRPQWSQNFRICRDP